MYTPRAVVRLLVPFLLSSFGCAEAGVWIVLDTIDGDDPYASMRQIEVTALEGEKRVESYRGVFYGGELELQPIARNDELVLRIEGLDLDAQIVAKGELAPEMPERAGSCCVHMCFCSLAVFDAGDCTCGSEQCRDTCVDSEE